MYRAKRWLPFLFLAGLAYLVYANWQLEQTEDLSRATACSWGGCSDDRPAKVDKGPFAHHYDWQAGGGLIGVTCRRGLVLFGRWECKTDRKRAAAVEGRDDMTRYPTATERSVGK